MQESDANMAEGNERHRIESIHEPGQNVEWAGRLYGGVNPHVRDDTRDIYMLRKEVQNLLQRRAPGFPGAQPVSFQRDHIDELRSQDYFVCEKSDGVRYLLWLTVDDDGGECQYLIDRKNQYWHVRKQTLHLPLPDDEAAFHKDTIIDGELVIDNKGNGVMEPIFLVFDCLILDGKPLIERTLDKRLGYFKDNVFKPYQDLMSKYPQELPFQPFLVELKNMQFSYGIEMMFRQILPSLRHGNDGLIFTCRNTAYCFGTDQHILKWKPAHENTVDFKMSLRFPTVTRDNTAPDEFDGDGGPYMDFDAIPAVDLYISRGGGQDPELVAELYLAPDEWETLKALGDPLNDRVVECGIDDQGRWRLYRFRDDKSDANHISTYKSVMNSIRNGVSEQDLLEAAKSIKDRWKARQAAQQQKR